VVLRQLFRRGRARLGPGRGGEWAAADGRRPRNPWLRLTARLATRVRVGQCTVLLPDGRRLRADGRDVEDSGPPVVLRIVRPRAVRRLLLGGSVGFAEAYMDGDWDSPDLAAFLEFAVRNENALGPPAEGLLPVRLVHRLGHLVRANTRWGSRRNIAEHYDLGNDFYGAWLDEGMTYSSALFNAGDQPLSEAQETKYRRLAGALGLRPGQHVLEIGCGWGGFAVMAAADYGCRVTALTLSERQAEYARRRVQAAGLADRVDIRIQDYRDVAGQFDRIASIEMFEAVGEAYWPAFFETVRNRLKAGGAAGLQVITIEEGRFQIYRKGVDFIQRYIFPGGMLPSPSGLSRQIAGAGLRLIERFAFGQSYALTLDRWQDRFQRAWPQIAALGYDERFRRMWEYYLAYCRAGFRAGSIDVWQLRIDRPS
jgi:cyclopropane-fatty-acyl-phospholipid synthase